VILETGTPDFSRADLMATAPSWGAETVAKEPLNYFERSEYTTLFGTLWQYTLAVGVLEAEIM
jgi:hypothetical protein